MLRLFRGLEGGAKGSTQRFMRLSNWGVQRGNYILRYAQPHSPGFRILQVCVRG